jgi:DNA adenine methylase
MPRGAGATSLDRLEGRERRRASCTPADREEARRGVVAKPFLKWAGGKGQLVDQFRPLFPTALPGRYLEPFVGSAAVFFALRPPRAVLTDVNRELIDCYRAVQSDVERVIEALRSHKYEEDYYYRVRAIEPEGLAPPERAARTIFLNKTGYNGLYRVNKKGRFNVPFGRYTNPGFCHPDALDNLRACARALREVTLDVRDFAEVVRYARAGDFVYFDPPYVPASSTADFTSYVPGGFGWEAQKRLADVFGELSRKGVLAMLSNSDTPAVRELYRDFRIDTVLASRSINSRKDKRGKVGEVVVRNYSGGQGTRVTRSV